jgi:hypothetical protein
LTAAIKAAARRLAESLPSAVHGARTHMHSDRRSVDAALDVLTEELEAFALACAGQTVPCATCGCPPSALPATFADHLPACAGCGTRAYAAMSKPAPPTDIRQTADEDERKAGAIAAASALSWGSRDDAERADAKAITDDALDRIRRQALGDAYSRPLTLDYIAGAADFFRELADALEAHVAKARETR